MTEDAPASAGQMAGMSIRERRAAIDRARAKREEQHEAAAEPYTPPTRADVLVNRIELFERSLLPAADRTRAHRRTRAAYAAALGQLRRELADLAG